MKRVTVKRMYNGEVVHEFPEAGVFYEDYSVVISVDSPSGGIGINYAKPLEGEKDVVVVEQYADDLAENHELVIDLILSGGNTQ
jgi:hypothetical protein